MLKIDLTNKIAFIAGVGDDQGFGWAIAKLLKEAGAKLIIGTWPPVHKIFTSALENGKFNESLKLSNGQTMTFEKIYPLDAAFDNLKDVPVDIKENKRYANFSNYTISEVTKLIEKDFGKIDIFVHSLANSPEVKNPLLETSRKGYLDALSASAYSFISLLKHLGPIFNKNSAALALSYIASTKAIPGYGGGMSSAKAALESDIRTLAWEAGRKWKTRVNCISAGPLKSRAAKAIGMIEYMINYSKENAPLADDLYAEDIANTAAFLLSDLAKGITGSTVFVDKGLHIMGISKDSKSLEGYPM